ncbi:substrate-binding domain-containing protein [Cupriavidus basilensis]
MPPPCSARCSASRKRLGRRLFERSRSRPPGDGTGAAVRPACRAHRGRAGSGARARLGNGRHGIRPGAHRLTTEYRAARHGAAGAGAARPPPSPGLSFELIATNELVSLTRRDADIAVRATRRPPDHLIGKCLGRLRVAVFVSRELAESAGVPVPEPGAPFDAAALSALPWIAPDEAMPDHPSVRWQRKHLPRVTPQYRVNSIAGVVEAVEAGLGAGVVSLMMGRRSGSLVALSGPLDECETDLWLLTHPESRHLRRIATVVSHLAEHVQARRLRRATLSMAYADASAAGMALARKS